MIPALIAGGRAALAIAPRLAGIVGTGARSAAAGQAASTLGANAVRGGMMADKVGRGIGAGARMAKPAWSAANAVASNPIGGGLLMTAPFLMMGSGEQPQAQAAADDMQAQGGYPQPAQGQQLPASGAMYQQQGANNVDPALDPEIRAKTMKRLKEQQAINDFYMQSLSSQPQQQL